MKEKIILSLSVVFIIGIMLISKNNQDSNLKSSLIQHTQSDIMNDHKIEPVDEIIINEKEDELSEKTLREVHPIQISNTCSLDATETDSFKFNDAFKYYRNCLSAHGNFNWRGKTYTTILAIEKDIHLTDSIKIKKQNEEISEKE